MAKKNNKSYLFVWVALLILVSLGCGSVQVGMVTPAPDGGTEPISEAQELELEEAAPTEEVGQPTEESAPAVAEEITESPDEVTVIAWLGHIASLPESSQYDDMVVLSPEGTGEFGLTGATPEIEAEIRSLRDAEGPEEFIHFWGTLHHNAEDYNNFQLVVDKMQYGANQSEEEVVDWVGSIRGSTFNSGTSYAFELPGDFPMWYSIYASQDPEIQAQVESLRDTGAVVEVSGKLLVGFPDVNGTRIEVSNLEVIEAGTQEQPALETSFDPTADWPVFVNERYGYQIKYPMEATISLFGPEGFFMEDKPEDMTPEQYMDSLLKEYTNKLCVKIEYSLGWIYISAPPNKEKLYTPCGPTGVGAGDLIPKIESVFVGDQLYEANGHEFFGKWEVDGSLVTGETLDRHNEMFRIELEDGTRISFGAIPHEEATYEDYLMKTKDMLLQIIATYEKVP